MESVIAASKNTSAVLVIFGVTGDLTYKKLLPSLYTLCHEKKLPDGFTIIGFARRNWNDDEFKEVTKKALAQAKTTIDPDTWAQFSAMLHYLPADFDDAAGYQKLQDQITAAETQVGTCLNRLFYFATPASLFPTLIKHLLAAKLNHGCTLHDTGKTRVIIEKPFGHNLASAKKLNNEFLQAFTEDQIYRIDHYLAKETVQNILAFRFANSLFEPLWNSQHIDHVQITAAEDIGIESRGAFYEETGALHDFFQNHLLQLMAAIACERPQSLAPEDIRAERSKVLQSLKPIADVASQTVRGQYSGYRQENNVDPNSSIETFVAAKAFLDTERFAGVPFYLRTGKKLKEKVSDITIQFKKVENPLYTLDHPSFFPNTVTLRLQPNEGISIRLFTKQPGRGNMIAASQMDFCYRDAYGTVGADAYARLLLDVVLGDQTLFTSSQEVEAAWTFVDPITQDWKTLKQPITLYEEGSWGPGEADDLIHTDGRDWLVQHLIVCPIHEPHTY